MKKLFAFLLVLCLICSSFAIIPFSAHATDDQASPTGGSNPGELTLGTNYFKAKAEEYEYDYPFTYERDKGVYTYTPEEDGALEAVVHDKEFYNPDYSWRFVITGGGLNTTLPAYLEKGVTYTIESQIENMSCLFSFRTCDSINVGETKDIVIGDHESLLFIPDSDMTVTYYSSFTPADDEVDEATASAVIKEDNEELTSVESAAPDRNNFMYSFSVKAGHTYILRNYHHWKAYERNFGEFKVSLEKGQGFEIENGTVISYSGSASTVKIPETYSTGGSDPEEVTKLGDSSFAGNDKIEQVAIPGTVTEIGEKAFFDCPSLLSVDIPDTVTSIGEHAFGYISGEGSEPQKLDGFTIRGYKDSAAQRYAEENGFTFIRLDDFIEIILPSRTGIKSLHAGENVRFVYVAEDDGEVTFRDDTSWNDVDIPDTSVTVTDSSGSEVASSDDFSHSIVGLPFNAAAGETYTITVNGKYFPEPSGENAGYVYERMYFELREVTEAALEQQYTGYSEYDDIDYTDYFDETRFFRFTAPEDGILSAKLLRKDLIEDGGYAYFDISDSENMSENTRLKTEVKKGHTYYIMSNFQMMSGIFKFVYESEDKEATNDESKGGTNDSSTPAGGSGVISGHSMTLLITSFCVMLAAAGLIFFARKKREE